MLISSAIWYYDLFKYMDSNYKHRLFIIYSSPYNWRVSLNRRIGWLFIHCNWIWIWLDSNWNWRLNGYRDWCRNLYWSYESTWLNSENWSHTKLTVIRCCTVGARWFDDWRDINGGTGLGRTAAACRWRGLPVLWVPLMNFLAHWLKMMRNGLFDDSSRSGLKRLI